MMCLMQGVALAQVANLPGAARLELEDGVIHLDPKPALFDAMLAGCVRQPQTRFLKEEGTIKPRVGLVRRLAEFTNAYPWEWTPSDRTDCHRHSCPASQASPGRGCLAPAPGISRCTPRRWDQR